MRGVRHGSRPSRSQRQLPGVLGEAFKFRCREQSRDQSLAQQPGGCALNVKLSANPLGLGDGCSGTVVGQGGMQEHEINARLSRVPVNHHGIFESLAEGKVGFKKALA